MVYVGKAAKEMTKSKHNLRARLNEHVAKIDMRQNISLADMKCRYLTFVSEWWVFAAEYALISHYTPNGTTPDSEARRKASVVLARIG